MRIKCQGIFSKKGCKSPQCDQVMEFSWSALWNITDETPDNCQMFLNCRGMSLFLECLQVSPLSPTLHLMCLLWNQKHLLSFQDYFHACYIFRLNIMLFDFYGSILLIFPLSNKRTLLSYDLTPGVSRQTGASPQHVGAFGKCCWGQSTEATAAHPTVHHCVQVRQCEFGRPFQCTDH